MPQQTMLGGCLFLLFGTILFGMCFLIIVIALIPVVVLGDLLSVNHTITSIFCLVLSFILAIPLWIKVGDRVLGYKK